MKMLAPHVTQIKIPQSVQGHFPIDDEASAGAIPSVTDQDDTFYIAPDVTFMLSHQVLASYSKNHGTMALQDRRFCDFNKETMCPL